jgi:hypothetical protein
MGAVMRGANRRQGGDNMDTVTISSIHSRLASAINDQLTLEQIVAAHRANPPRDLDETRDPLAGRPVPAGMHQLLIEALGGDADVRIPAGMHGRVARAVAR